MENNEISGGQKHIDKQYIDNSDVYLACWWRLHQLSDHHIPNGDSRKGPSVRHWMETWSHLWAVWTPDPTQKGSVSNHRHLQAQQQSTFLQGLVASKAWWPAAIPQQVELVDFRGTRLDPAPVNNPSTSISQCIKWGYPKLHYLLEFIFLW